LSLRDKVGAERTLAVAWERVKRNRGAAGVDRQRTEAFMTHVERWLAELRDALVRGRYADDFVVLCTSQDEAALGAIQDWVAEQGLTLHPDKTRIVDVGERGGFDALGLFTMTAARKAAGSSR
jgi:retron-type reverse transcriptase